jgi:hypothetical protein
VWQVDFERLLRRKRDRLWTAYRQRGRNVALELTYKVLAKQLRISDRKVLDAAYDGENQRHGTEVGIQNGSLSRDPR